MGHLCSPPCPSAPGFKFRHKFTTLSISVFVAVFFCSGKLSWAAYSSVLSDPVKSLSGPYLNFPFESLYMSMTLGYLAVNVSIAKGNLPFAARQLQESAKCPRSLNLALNKISNKITFSLHVPRNECSMSPDMSPSAPLVDYGKLMGSFFNESVDSPNINNNVMRYFATGTDLLKCPAASFSELTITWLAQSILTYTYGVLRVFGQPPAVFESLFGRLSLHGTVPNASVPPVWRSIYMSESKKVLRKAISGIDKIPVILLTNSSPATGASSPENSNDCFYVPAQTYNATMNKTQAIAEACIPVVMQMAMPPLNYSATTFRLADANCQSASIRRLKRIDISNITSNIKASDAGIHVSKVKVDGVECASTHVSRLLTTEAMMPSSLLGRKTVQLAKKIEKLVEENGGAELVQDAIYAQLLSTKLANPARFAAILRKKVFKAKVLVAPLDVSVCENVKGLSEVGMLIIDLPASKYFCAKVPTAKLPYNCSKLELGISAFVFSNKPEETACLYTSSERLLKNISPLPSAPGPPATDSDSDGPEKTTPSKPPLQKSPSNGTLPPSSAASPGAPSPSSPSPKAISPRSGSASKACFPADATVNLAGGGRVAMKCLRVGDMVEVSPDVFSPVLLFTHAVEGVRSRMTVVESANGTLVASASHYVYVNGALAAAKDIRQGDFLLVQHAHELRKERVTRVSSRVVRGLYNPQTARGKVLVRYGERAAVLASAYTTAVHPFAAHLAMAPLRSAHALFGVVLPGFSTLFPETRVRRNPGAECRQVAYKVPERHEWQKSSVVVSPCSQRQLYCACR